MVNKKAQGVLNSLKHRAIKMLEPEWDESEANRDPPDSKAEQASEFRINEAVSQKIKAVIDDFIEAAPLIEEAGFRIRDLEIELGVIPKLIPHFEKLTDTDESNRLAIVERVKDKKIILLLLKALFKADNFQKSLNMGNLEFAGIEIDITAIPAVRLVYKNPTGTSFDTDR